MRLCTLVSVVFSVLQTRADVIYQLGDIYINATQAIYTLFPAASNCDANSDANFQLYFHVESSNYFIDQKNIQYYAQVGGSNVSSSTPSFTFSVRQSNYNIIGVTAVITCRGNTIIDAFLLLAESADTYNSTSLSVLSSQGRNNPSLTLSTSYQRRCDNFGKYFGFNCDQICDGSRNDNQYCYSCVMSRDNQPQLECCQDYTQYLNPDTCAWLNSTCVFNSTTSAPCPEPLVDKGKENLYFWLMIGFVILSGVLIILLLLLLILLCMRQNQKQTVTPVYVQPARAEIIESRRVSERPRRDREASPYPRRESSRRAYRDEQRREPRGSYQLEYDLDDDSLRNDWVEPMPRRVAKRDDLHLHSSPPQEPKDVVV